MGITFGLATALILHYAAVSAFRGLSVGHQSKDGSLDHKKRCQMGSHKPRRGKTVVTLLIERLLSRI